MQFTGLFDKNHFPPLPSPPLPHVPRSAVAMHCEALWSLMRQFSSGHAPLASLPPSAQRELMSGLVMCGAGEQREAFLAEVSHTVLALLLLLPLTHTTTV